MEYLREGLTHILDRLKMKSDLLATARMQVSTVRQATNDMILLTVHCFMVGQEDQWNYPIEISGLDIAQTAGDQGGLVRLLESRAMQALEALDRVAREYVEILEFVQKSDREEPAPEIPKSVPYDIVRGAAELPERDPWISRSYVWEGQHRRLSTREALEAIYDTYAARSEQVANNLMQNNALLGRLRRRAGSHQPQSATEIAIHARMVDIETQRHEEQAQLMSRSINQDLYSTEIRFLDRPVYIIGLDFALEQSQGNIHRTASIDHEFMREVPFEVDPSRAEIREANTTTPDDVINSWRVCAAMRGGHQFKADGSCRKCGYYAPRHRQPRRRNRM